VLGSFPHTIVAILAAQYPLGEVQTIVAKFINYYNTRRLHSAIRYVNSRDLLEGQQKEIFVERDRKLPEARERRAEERRLPRAVINAKCPPVICRQWIEL
jgi:hypothetical protein